MIEIAGQTFLMGSERFYPEEAPMRRVRVDRFWIDETPVTNREFAEFVDDTGYKTFAEIPPDPRDYPGMAAEMAFAGSLVFQKISHLSDLADASQWWRFSAGADWRHPTGAESSIDGLEDHPVVHIAHADAMAFAKWAGKQLPTEAEWEVACRGGVDGADFAWGEELAPEGRMLANYWQGAFPIANLMSDGWERTSPVRSFPANGYGLFDMIGNVWEWTADWYALPQRVRSKAKGGCCVPANPRGGTMASSRDSHGAAPRKVLKGGSHLCAPNYCQRYRPAARYPQPIDTTTSHVGFRCVKRSQPVVADVFE